MEIKYNMDLGYFVPCKSFEDYAYHGFSIAAYAFVAGVIFACAPLTPMFIFLTCFFIGYLFLGILDQVELLLMDDPLYFEDLYADWHVLPANEYYALPAPVDPRDGDL